MAKEFWHECTQCKSIFDTDTLTCPSCETKNPQKLGLTLKEVLERVDNPARVWTKQPRRFDSLLEERAKKALAEAGQED